MHRVPAARAATRRFAFLSLVLALCAAGRARADNKAPVIEHAPVTTVSTGAVVTFEARMVDKDGIYEPKVFVRPAGRTAWTPFSFEKSKDDQYRCEVPPGMTANGAFAYYVEAFDSSGNGPTRIGSPEKPLEVVALQPPPVPVRVSIRAEPDDAAVTIDGRAAGKSPVKKELLPGSHVVVVRAAGRRALEQRLELVSGRDVDVFVALRPDGGTGKLRVTSSPPGARLLVDGTGAGETPFEAKGLKGKRKLRVELRGFVPEEREVSLEEGLDSEVAFALRPMPDDPALVVESLPTGAKVLIDGRARGQTPWIGVVGAGAHELVLEGAEGRALSTAFTMPGKNDLLLRLQLPEPRADGVPLLAILTEPAGADVTIAGQKVGRTPFLGAVPSGEAAIRIELEGYQPLDRKFLFDGKRDRELHFALERVPGPGHVAITARPANAELMLDGMVVGKGPVNLQVDPGEHEVAAKVPGHRTVAQRVQIAAGQRLAVTLDLPLAPEGSSSPTLVVESRPLGASVVLDGKEIGKTPLARTAVAPGKHAVKITLAGHASYESAFEVPNVPMYELRLAASLASTRALDERPTASRREVVDAQLARGIECFSKKDWACGADAFHRAFELEPDPDYLFQEATALANQAKWAEAATAARATEKAATSERLRRDAGALAKRCEDRAAGGAPEALAAAEDTAPPTLEHAALQIAYRHRPARLVATIRDASGIFMPRACWRSLLAPEFECAELQPGSNDAYRVEVPGSAVSQGFAYFIEAFDVNGNGPATSGSAKEPHGVSMEDPPEELDALAGVSSDGAFLPEDEAGSGTLAWASLGVGAVASVAAIVAAGLVVAAVSGDTVDATGRHTMTQAEADSARTLQSAAIGLGVVGAVGLGVGYLLLPPAGSGGDAVAGVSVGGTF